MKFIKTLLASALLLGSVSAFAVTEQEMEQARTTTAKIYLRWSNNMSGYLDDTNPTTMAELESLLKEDDARNLEAFKNAGVPSNYSSWDKDELIKYWTSTFFENASGLSSQGTNQGARGRMKAELKKIKVGAPASETAEPQTNNAPEGSSEPSSALAQGNDEAAKDAKDVMTDNPDEIMEGQPAPKDNEGGSGTWVYILILIILVIAVILLVTYASRTMKGGGGSRRGGGGFRPRQRRNDYRDDTPKRDEEKDYPSAIVTPMARKVSEPATRSSESENGHLQETLTRRLSAKQDEINTLNRKLTELQTENSELSMSVVRLRKENERLKKDVEALRDLRQHQEVSFVEETPALAPAPAAAREPQRHVEEAPRSSDIKEIFLGRVNSNGVFVRADRAFSPGNSVYKLVTTDGFSGTYRVVDNRTLEMLALEHPEEFLAGGCVAKDITDTIGRTSIITESAGTAIFEGGAWRVIRKARIRYD